MSDGTAKLDALNNTLGSVENKLLHRAVERDREELDQAFGVINKAIDDGAIELEPAPDAEEPAEATSEPEGTGEAE